MAFSSKLSASQVKRQLKASLEARSASAKEAIEAVAQEVLEDARSMAPIKTGALRESGEIEIQDTPHRRRVKIIFRTRYASIQHEATWYSHPGGGEAKFLAKALAKVTLKGIASRMYQKNV